MCLLIIAIDQHPELPLIVAGNRDEFHSRPTQDAHWWPDQPDTLGGRDLQAGGTWLAVNKRGRFAAVTNFRDAQREHRPLQSRGHLVTGFLGGSDSPVDHTRMIDGDQFGGFNLLLAEPGSAAYLSNRGAPTRGLEAGVYGLSNATLDDPWTKVTRSKTKLVELLSADDVNETTLLRLLDDRDKGSPDEVESNGLSFSMAHALTAPFVLNAEYGTRCSTVVTLSSSGQVRFVERRFAPDGSPIGDSSYSFRLGED